MIKFGSFAYKIDYAASIAADEKEIAALSDPLAAAVAPVVSRDIASRPELRACGWCVLTFILTTPEERAARVTMLGLTEDDVRAMCVVRDVPITDDMQPGDFERGRALWERWESFPFVTEEERRSLLKLHKTRLARHRRNQEKYG